MTIFRAYSVAAMAMGIGLAVVLAACGARETRVQQGTREGVLHVGNDAEPQELDPHLVTGVPEQRILLSLFEGLTTLDPKTLEPKPGVAESWTVSDDKRIYTFALRKDARWSDGSPVTAQDFVYAWQRILSPKLAAEYAYMLHCIENAKAFNDGTLTDFSEVGAKALDDYTLEITLAHPTPSLLSMQVHSSWFPVNQACIEKHGAIDTRNTGWTQPGELVGNGPFQLVEWKPGQVIVVARNENYWDATSVKLNEIRFYPMEDLQTEERSFRSGDLHITGDMPIGKIPVYQRDNLSVLVIHPYLGTYFYRFNLTKPPFSDVRVRKAFALALNRDEIVRNVTKGGERAASSFVPPDTVGYTSTNAMPYDPDRARKLLAEAGFPKGQGLPPVELLYNTSENHKLIAEAAAEMWKKELGVTTVLLNQDAKVCLASTIARNYQVARSSWIGDVLDPVNFLECFLTTSGNNRTGWSSVRYDDLIAQAQRAPDVGERNRLLNEAEGILLDEAPILPVYTYTRKFLKSPDLKGWEPNILGYVLYKNLSLGAS